MKVKLTNNLLLYPCPVILLTSKLNKIENVMTVAWTGIASSKPEFVTVAIKPERYTYHLIKESGEFGINVPASTLVYETDWCGSVSGKDFNKFEKCNFNKFYGDEIKAPLISECPVNIECKVVECIKLGGHDLFVAQVINKLINSDIPLDNIHSHLDPLTYFRPNYYTVNTETLLGHYGYSVNTKK